MAAPAAAQKLAFRFRDVKGEVARMTVVVGGATPTAVEANAATLKGHLQAISNAHVSLVITDYTDAAYGTAATYQNVEDKAKLSWSLNGTIHRYQLPAPISTLFLADSETVDKSQGGMVNLLADFNSFVYAPDVAISGPFLTTGFLGGFRVRQPMHRRLNIYIKDPTETIPAE